MPSDINFMGRWGKRFRKVIETMPIKVATTATLATTYLDTLANTVHGIFGFKG